MGRGWRTVVDRIERTASRLGRAESRRCSIEGLRLHERALRAGVGIEAAVLSRSLRESGDPRCVGLLAELDASGCELHVVPASVVASLTEGRGLGEIVGLLALPEPWSLEALWAARGDGAGVLLAGCDIEEPGNTGALVRTALAGGAAGFAAVGTTDPWHPKALRTSMGSAFKLPWLRAASAAALTEDVWRLGGVAYAAVSRGGEPPAALGRVVRPLALLFGGESRGLPPETLEAVDGRVSIPMAAGVDSFSVNAAAAILLYEAGGRREP